MVAKTALSEFIEEKVREAALGDALYGAKEFGSLRGDVSAERKVVRSDAWGGKFQVSDEEKRTEMDVDAMVQCHVQPKGDTDFDLEEAIEESFQMAKRLCYLINTEGLGNSVCDAYFEDFESDTSSLGGTTRGSTYIFGKINNI